jgi:hypothetical protein
VTERQGQLADVEQLNMHDANLCERSQIVLGVIPNQVHTKCVSAMSIRLGDCAETMISEIREALTEIDGEKPTKSRVLRLAVATLRKRMSDEGLLREPT